MNLLFHLMVLFMAPIFAIGVIHRSKAYWAGRKGPNLNQFFFDLKRLLRKTPVYSESTSWVFQLSPWIVLGTGIMAGLLSPILPGFSPISFPYDFIYFAYLLALGRVFLILGALDTGSSFEGMGASREATYSTFAEPILFFAVGTLGLISGHTSFQELMNWGSHSSIGWVVRIPLSIALFILLQIEAARLPVDDPNTHLELTMIHEVMILDSSGPELAALQYGAAMKLILLAGILACLLNPLSALENPALGWGMAALLLILLSVLIGSVESWMARFRLRAIPAYAFLGIFAGIVSLALAIFRLGGAR